MKFLKLFIVLLFSIFIFSCNQVDLWNSIHGNRDLLIHVHPSGNDATGSGTRGNPLRTIQKAIDVAVPGTSIHVAGGDYRVDGTAAAPVIALKAGVTLYGGYSPADWDVPRDELANPTIITDERTTAAGTDENNPMRTVEATGGSVDNLVVMDGFSI